MGHFYAQVTQLQFNSDGDTSRFQVPHPAAALPPGTALAIPVQAMLAKRAAELRQIQAFTHI
jgi:hypothetical protein